MDLPFTLTVKYRGNIVIGKSIEYTRGREAEFRVTPGQFRFADLELLVKDELVEWSPPHHMYYVDPQPLTGRPLLCPLRNDADLGEVFGWGWWNYSKEIFIDGGVDEEDDDEDDDADSVGNGAGNGAVNGVENGAVNGVGNGAVNGVGNGPVNGEAIGAVNGEAV